MDLQKKSIEEILEWYSKLKGINYSALRYFNAAGYDVDGEISGIEQNPVNLIPVIMETACGFRSEMTILGYDYDTPDGTCIRDYIHVTDLADAHVLALQYLEEGNNSNEFNLGNGQGFSVREVIDSVKKVTGKDFKVVETDRREGDPAILIGSSEKAKETLNWNPQYVEIDKIVDSAWKWHKNLNKEYL